MERRSVRAILTIVPVLLLAGCVAEPAASGSAAPPGTTQAATSSPASSPSAVLSPSPGASAAVQSPDGAELRITVSATTIAVGQALTVFQVVTNVGSETIQVDNKQCGGPALVEVELPFPTTPTGATLSGQLATFKQWMLDNALTTGQSRSSTYRTPFGPLGCGGYHPIALAPGGQLTGSRSDPITQVPGVTLPGGPATIVATLFYWQVPATPLPTLGPNAKPAMRVPILVSVSIPISVVGSAPHVLSAGQAVDAALKITEFAAFVAANPPDSWERGILMLNDYYGWDIELQLKSGGFAAARLDPMTGTVSWHRTCTHSCS
jgi:hypothetical protein